MNPPAASEASDAIDVLPVSAGLNLWSYRTPAGVHAVLPVSAGLNLSGSSQTITPSWVLPVSAGLNPPIGIECDLGRARSFTR